jgi:hypothetical protein
MSGKFAFSAHDTLFRCTYLEEKYFGSGIGEEGESCVLYEIKIHAYYLRPD